MATNLAGRIDRAIRISLILLAAAAVLAVLLVVTKSRPEPVPLSSSALGSETINLPPVEGIPGGALVENPLFWASRRPYNAPGEEVEEEVQPSGATGIEDMRLVGVITSGIETSAVIVTVRGQRQRIPFGGEVDGWELISMAPTSATFLGPGRNGEFIEHTLNLEDSRSQPRESQGARANPSNQRSWFSLDNDTDPDTVSDSVEDQDDPQDNQDQNG